MADISKIKLPNGTTYNIKDSKAMPVSGGTFTGPVTFGDTMTAPEANVGDLMVTGAASFTNNLQANTINGVTVGASPKFTDTTYTLSISNNRITLTPSSGSSSHADLPIYFVEVGSDEDYESAWAAYNSGKLIVGRLSTGQGIEQITKVEQVNKPSVRRLIFTSVQASGEAVYTWNCITGEWLDPDYIYFVTEDNIVDYLPIYDGTVA